MIKFLATNVETGRTILGIILTEENIKYLKDDKPVHFDVEEMPGIKQIVCEEIMIMYYPTMEIAIANLIELGYIPPSSKLTVVKKQTH